MVKPSKTQRSATGSICLLVPDGRGVRDFVLGSFLRHAVNRGRVDIFHVIDEAVLPEYRAGFINGEVVWHPLLGLRERPVPFTLRMSVAYAQMYWVDNFAMRRNRSRPVNGSWRTKAAVRTAKLIGRAAATPYRIRMLDRLHRWSARRLPEVERYRRLFERIRPRLLFTSQQGSSQILAPVLAAKSLRIPAITFVRSWDNLSSKERIAAPFDHYLVWSDHTCRDLLRYYPEVSRSQVHSVGSPQFDPYADASLLWTREDFCRRIGADSKRPLICFTGGSPGNAKEDPQHVAVLMTHIRAQRIKHNPQVLLRPCPSDEGTRFDEVRRDYPELICAQPACNHTQPGNWMAVVPRAEDVQFLANLTHHADLNVNFASTMTLDFAIHDKPVVNVAFDVSSPPHFGMPMWDYYQKWDHYRPVIELGAARFARFPDELAEHVNAYLDNPALDRDGRRRFVELEVGVPIGRSSLRIIEVLEEIAS